MLLASNKNKAPALVSKNDNKGVSALHYVVRGEKASPLLRLLLNIDSLDINQEDQVCIFIFHISIQL